MAHAAYGQPAVGSCKIRCLRCSLLFPVQALEVCRRSVPGYSHPCHTCAPEGVQAGPVPGGVGCVWDPTRELPLSCGPVSASTKMAVFSALCLSMRGGVIGVELVHASNPSGCCTPRRSARLRNRTSVPNALLISSRCGAGSGRTPVHPTEIGYCRLLSLLSRRSPHSLPPASDHQRQTHCHFHHSLDWGLLS